MMLRAVTLWQPWASLAALGLKQYETRSWRTAYRGPLLIHAAKSSPMREAVELARMVDWRLLLGLPLDLPPRDALHALPRGAVIGCVSLAGCLRVEVALQRDDLRFPRSVDRLVLTSSGVTIDKAGPHPDYVHAELAERRLDRKIGAGDFIRVGYKERSLGNYSRGRFAWELRAARSFITPLPFSGRQGIWFASRALVESDAQRAQAIADCMAASRRNQ